MLFLVQKKEKKEKKGKGKNKWGLSGKMKLL